MSNRLNIRRGRELRNKRSPRKKRSKTFKTEDSAHAHAKKNNIANYDLHNLKHSTNKVKKLMIVEKKE
jgi:hypothetical protein|tara:strand:+ start:759 stop:962 length:204 start_codon:yes stop_codon:yes gene_type:complete